MAHKISRFRNFGCESVTNVEVRIDPSSVKVGLMVNAGLEMGGFTEVGGDWLVVRRGPVASQHFMMVGMELSPRVYDKCV